MKGTSNWSGRVPRTTEEAFGVGQTYHPARESNPDTVWHLVIAVFLMILVGLALGWNP